MCEIPSEPLAVTTEIAVVREVSARAVTSEEAETPLPTPEGAGTDGGLRAVHDTFRYLVEHSPFGIYAVDADFRLVQVSVGAQKVFANVRPLLGRDFAEILRIIWSEPFASEAIALFRHTLETGEPYHAPGTIERRQDTEQVESYDWKIERMLLPDGRLGVVCHFYDLSERLEYEAALRMSEERFRGTFEQAAVGMAHVGLDGEWLRVNQRLCDIVGYTRDELLRSRFQEITHPDDVDADLQQAERLISGEIATYAMEKRYIRQDGSIVWIDLTVSLMRDEAGTPLYFISVVEDITQRKRSEERLHKSEERFRIAENAAHSFVYDYDAISGLEERSDGFTKMLGYRQEELPHGGAMWETLIHPDDVARVRALTQEAGQVAPPVVSLEYRLRHKEGRWVWVIDEFVVMRDAQGDVRQIVGSIVDITVQKQQQQQIADLNARLQRAVAETHHRVKNNLQMLSGLVEMQMPDDGEVISVSTLRRVGQHIRTLASLHDLLTLDSKLAADQDTVFLNAALERLVSLLQSTDAGERRIRLHAEEMRATLKQSSSFVLLVNELISNALKHGRGEVLVTLNHADTPDGTEEAVRTALLEVSDDGPGFSDTFDLRSAASTGLELIESLGRWDLRGQIVYRNREQGGACVVVSFPLTEVVES